MPSNLYHVTITTPNGTEGRLMMLFSPPPEPPCCICSACGGQCYHFRGRSRCCDAVVSREDFGVDNPN